jgi:hypothetical protein
MKGGCWWEPTGYGGFTSVMRGFMIFPETIESALVVHLLYAKL